MTKTEVINELSGMVNKVEACMAFEGRTIKARQIKNAIDFLNKYKTGNRIESFILIQAKTVFGVAMAMADEKDRIIEEARLRYERLNNDR
jgi:hypothetical protein